MKRAEQASKLARLSERQVDVLSALALEGEPISATEFYWKYREERPAAWRGYDRGGIHSALVKLEERGLVERVEVERLYRADPKHRWQLSPFGRVMQQGGRDFAARSVGGVSEVYAGLRRAVQLLDLSVKPATREGAVARKDAISLLHQAEDAVVRVIREGVE